MKIRVVNPTAAVSEEQILEAIYRDPRARAILANAMRPKPAPVSNALEQRIKKLEARSPRSTTAQRSSANLVHVGQLFEFIDLALRTSSPAEVEGVLLNVAGVRKGKDVAPEKRRDACLALRKLYDAKVSDPQDDMDFG